MPRFYFHVYDDIIARDDEGVEIANPEAAIAAARLAAAELAADEVRKGELHLDHRIVIEDESGTVIDTIMFRDIVTVSGAETPA